MYATVALGESISYALQYRVPISNVLTSNPVNPGPLMRVPGILCIRHDWGEHLGGLGESISYALQCRAPISDELTSISVNPGPSLWVPVIRGHPGVLIE